MGLKSTLQFILNHPLNRDHKWKALNRFVGWQFNTRFNQWPVVYPITEKAKLLVKKGMTGATGNVYCGLHDYEDMFFLLHFLRPNDLFVDIGANVGSYTVLASGHCQANSISIEPVPSTFKILQDNIALNQMESKVSALNMALGSSAGIIPFTTALDTINHVALQKGTDTIDVPVSRLDTVIGDKNPQLLKIDVEGYETEVLSGAGDVLENRTLKAIIIELNGAGSNYGFDESKIHELLLSFGFQPCRYNPKERKLLKLSTFGNLNTIYTRDFPFVEERLLSAPRVKILDQDI